MLNAHVHPRCIARPILKKKTFRVVENHCLQCVESILVNLPQFAKFGLKGSLNRCFWYFSLHLSGYFGLVSSLFVSVSVCFTAVLSMAVPPKRTVGRPHRLGSPKYIRLHGSVFFISGKMGKKLLAANSTDSVFAKFLLHRMLMFNCKLISLAVVFSIVTQSSSKVEANQNTAFDKRIVSKQKHKHAKPFG